ncbi:uncharacterized protein N7483_013218 [Penicillium malachiteum]|uniref:uncharacterized protein n=1 Tax=Penicillium malachiteum TaxID=1324776 RepID=UPI002546FD54|nr:uncharacterized protein N7483_013218 [Penicillium malachiteum]KAJ5716037.1 hypothetical protein N7483_013218 [Penicillium malachiteum]
MIQNLDKTIGDPFCMTSNPHQSLHNCCSLLQILEEEFDGYPGAHLARLYYDAFQICSSYEDEARAGIFQVAERAYQARVICEGKDSPETQGVKSLASEPTDPAGFGMS